jgi:hypothetical protein
MPALRNIISYGKRETGSTLRRRMVSKSMLIIDTPKSCELCNFCGYAGEKDRVCLASPTNQILEDGYYTIIPDWCPLKEVSDE